MSCFGTTHELQHSGFEPTFRIQGQIYHTLGSLLPICDESHTFVQIYFIGDGDAETIEHCMSKSYTGRDEWLIPCRECFLDAIAMLEVSK